MSARASCRPCRLSFCCYCWRNGERMAASFSLWGRTMACSSWRMFRGSSGSPVPSPPSWTPPPPRSVCSVCNPYVVVATMLRELVLVGMVDASKQRAQQRATNNPLSLIVSCTVDGTASFFPLCRANVHGRVGCLARSLPHLRGGRKLYSHDPDFRKQD